MSDGVMRAGQEITKAIRNAIVPFLPSDHLYGCALGSVPACTCGMKEVHVALEVATAVIERALEVSTEFLQQHPELAPLHSALEALRSNHTLEQNWLQEPVPTGAKLRKVAEVAAEGGRNEVRRAVTILTPRT